MDVFEFAMKMEQDGRAYYEKMASQAENKTVKDILQELAQDEIKHYNIFKRFKQGDFSDAEKMRSSQTAVLQKARNIFEKLSRTKQSFAFSSDVRLTWTKAQDIEKKSEDFYRSKAAEEKDEKVKKTLDIIADEEHKHWVLIENVIQFLDRPQQWLEDAEWNHLEKY
jgi:rubrerythrin